MFVVYTWSVERMLLNAAAALAAAPAVAAFTASAKDCGFRPQNVLASGARMHIPDNLN